MALGFVFGSCFVGSATISGFAVAEDLYFLCPAEKEEIAEGGVVAAVNLDVEASSHVLGTEAADDGTAGIVGYIAKHGGEVAVVVGACLRVVKADGVVVVVVPEGLLGFGMLGVVEGALLL